MRRAGGPPPAGALTWVSPHATTRVRARVVEPSPECRRLLEGGAGGGEAWIGALKAACATEGLEGRAVLLFVWLAGGATLLLLGVRDRWRLGAELAGCSPADGRIAAIGASLVGSRPGRARILVSDTVPAPCAVGRCVVLPARCEQEMDDGELSAVLAHELAHLARRDPAWLAAADLVCRLAWIQPLNRVAAAGVRDAAELMTDQHTLRHTRPLDLARSIHRVSHWAVPHRRPARVSGLARPRDGSLTRRVRRILAPAREGDVGPAWPGALLALALSAGVMLLPPVAMTRELRAIMIELEGPASGRHGRHGELGRGGAGGYTRADPRARPGHAPGDGRHPVACSLRVGRAFRAPPSSRRPPYIAAPGPRTPIRTRQELS